MQVGRDTGLKVRLEESQQESYYRRQCPEGLRDNHPTRGTNGTETPEQSTVSVVGRNLNRTS
jgi:hypothetical protein